MAEVYDKVKDYYGKEIKATADFKTGCGLEFYASLPDNAKEALKLVHPAVKEKNFGCAVVYPGALEGCRVLDLGSGAGLDCFIISKLVGEDGHVTGIDMTAEQLDVARKYIDYHTEQFGYSKPNVDFREGYIEKLSEAGLTEGSFDVIVSNCVVDLSPDKQAVFQEAYRVLKYGGEMYFSDIYTNKPIPEHFKSSKVLWGEGIAGALHYKDLVQLTAKAGFAPPILVKSEVYNINNPEIQKILDAEGIQVCAATYRLFKVDLTESNDCLVKVQYKGCIRGCEEGFPFSYLGAIPVGSAVVMPSSVERLLSQSRFATHFSYEPVPTTQADGLTPIVSGINHFLDVDPFTVATTRTSTTESTAIQYSS